MIGNQEKILTEIKFLRRDINGTLKSMTTHIKEADKYRPWMASAMEVTKWSRRVIVVAIVGGACAWIGVLIKGALSGS